MCGLRILTVLSMLSMNVCAQQVKERVSVNFQDLPLEQILDSITYQSGYFFSYNADAIPKGSLYSFKRSRIKVDSLLSELLVGTGLEYLKEDDQIIIRKVPESFTYKVVAGNEKKSIIRGWVRDEQTNEPIVGANVFLNGTTIGGVTDRNGNYEIREVPPGTHQLVISFVGFETNAYQIKAYDGNTYILNTLLETKTEELPVVEIISRPLVDSSEWSNYYRIFEKEFIGFSQNSFRCEMQNPEVIGFTYDPEEDILNAYAEEPLMVENRALGYRIQCQLAFFERKGKVTRFHIRALFENMAYENNRTKRRWKRNREATYNGSSPHFFKTLIEDRFYQEGFRCFLVKNKKNIKVDRDDILKKDSIGYNWILNFDSTLMVQYTRETESPEYLEYIGKEPVKTADVSSLLSISGRPTGSQVSILELKKNNVILFSNGQVQNPEDIVRLGYWSWERLSDLMPINYDPKNDW